MSLIPDWMYWIAIGVLTAAIGAQQVRVANVYADLATEQKERAEETRRLTQIALDRSTALRDLESKHAAEQQQKEEAYAAKILAVKNAAAADRVAADRLRGQLSTYSSSGTRPGETDAAACERVKNRLPLVGNLLAEGISLEAESRELIRQRDAKVGLLLGQIQIDRAACSLPTR